MAKPTTCPECGGAGTLPADNEGDRPMVTCDMCGGAGWGTLLDGCGCHDFWEGQLTEDACGCPCHKEPGAVTGGAT